MDKELFLKYPSLTNHYAIGSSRAIVAMLEKQYYATEKVDGSNVSITINMETGEYAFGKRSGFIEEGDKPFDDMFNLVSFEDMNGIIQKLNELEITGIVHVYGELYGAKIQKQDYDIVKEQKRAVILYDVIQEEGDGDIYELSLKELDEVIPDKFKTPVVRMGTLRELLDGEVPNTSQYGGVNEGYVYKPVDGYEYNPDSEGSYPVVKHKTDLYLEVRNVKKPKHDKPMIANVELHDGLLNYVTSQRVMNIVSHGDYELTNKNIGALIKEMIKDIKKEYTAENETKFPEEEMDTTLKQMSREIANTVKKTVMENGGI